MASDEEVRKRISAPLSDDPVTRQKQKVDRKALVLQRKGFRAPKRKAQVLAPKPKEKKKEKQEGGFFEILKELRKKGNL